jgi:hypothetical protein
MARAWRTDVVQAAKEAVKQATRFIATAALRLVGLVFSAAKQAAKEAVKCAGQARYGCGQFGQVASPPGSAVNSVPQPRQR